MGRRFRKANASMTLQESPIGRSVGRVVIAAHQVPPETVTSGFDVVRVDPFGLDGRLEDALLRDTTVLFSDTLPANFDGLTDLRWLQLGSAGYAQVSGHGLTQRGITVTNAGGVNDIPIAEWCVLAMLSLERGFVGMLDHQRAHDYNRSAKFQRELRGRTLGIIGYGGVGRELARLSRAMGLSVWVMNRSAIGPAVDRFTPAGTGDIEGVLPDRYLPFGDWQSFLPHLDYLALTVALNQATKGLLGDRELGWLPSHAYLLNPARAQLVDEEALRSALCTGSLAGAALDSHYREPLSPDDDTWDLPNTIITPHISGSTRSPHYWARIWELFSQNLDRYRMDLPLLNVVPVQDLS